MKINYEIIRFAHDGYCSGNCNIIESFGKHTITIHKTNFNGLCEKLATDYALIIDEFIGVYDSIIIEKIKKQNMIIIYGKNLHCGSGYCDVEYNYNDFIEHPQYDYICKMKPFDILTFIHYNSGDETDESGDETYYNNSVININCENELWKSIMIK